MSEVVIFYPSTGLDKKNCSVGLPMSALHAATLVAQKYSTRIIDQRVEKNWERTLKQELKTKPICVGISAMTGSQIGWSIKASQLVRKFSPKTPIVWGGVHASLLPHQTLRNKNVDIVVINEGETTFLKLIDHLKNKRPLEKIKGIGFIRKNKIILTSPREFEDLSKLPDIPYHLINVQNYFLNLYQSKKTLSLQTGRGCPHRCMYCYNKAYHNRRYRSFTMDQIISKIKKYISFGAKSIDLVDDNFFVSKDRVKELCKRLKKEKIDIRFMTNVRMDYIARCDIDYLRMLKESGFNELFIGIESGSDKVLKSVKKDLTVVQIIEGNRKLKAAGIKAIYSFMAGFPGETKEDIKETIDLRSRLLKENPNISLTALKIFTPYPGSELYDVCLEKKFKQPRNLADWSSFNYNTAKYKWGSKSDTKFLEKLSYLTYFDDEKTALHHFGTNAITKFLISLYCKIVKFRCKYHFYFFTPEISVFKIIYKKFGS